MRDGAQAEGISFTVNDKLKIVQKLDEFGIDYVEAGNSGSNPKDLEFFKGRPMELKTTAGGFRQYLQSRQPAEEDSNPRLLKQTLPL